jgi:hypothetical protein
MGTDWVRVNRERKTILEQMLLWGCHRATSSRALLRVLRCANLRAVEQHGISRSSSERGHTGVQRCGYPPGNVGVGFLPNLP